VPSVRPYTDAALLCCFAFGFASANGFVGGSHGGIVDLRHCSAPSSAECAVLAGFGWGKGGCCQGVPYLLAVFSASFQICSASGKTALLHHKYTLFQLLIHVDSYTDMLLLFLGSCHTNQGTQTVVATVRRLAMVLFVKKIECV